MEQNQEIFHNRKKKFRRTIAIIGSIATIIATLITLASIFHPFKKHQNKTFEFVANLHGPEGNQDILVKSGTLIVDINTQKHPVDIDIYGVARVGEIPIKYLKDSITIGLESEGFQLVNPFQKYILNGDVAYVQVQKDDSLGIIKGRITDVNAIPLDDVEILVDYDSTIQTNKQGIFKVNLPNKMRKTQYELIISKKGFETERRIYYAKSQPAEIILSKTDEKE